MRYSSSNGHKCVVAAHLPSQPRPVHQKSKDDGALYSLSSATTLLPGQDKLAPSCPISGESCFVVSCEVMLSEIGSETVRKPQVARSIRVAGSIDSAYLDSILLFHRSSCHGSNRNGVWFLILSRGVWYLGCRLSKLCHTFHRCL